MKAIVSLSGGMDSGTSLLWAKRNSQEVLAIGFVYRSKHNSYEQKCAVELTEYFEVRFIRIDLTGISNHLKSNLLQSGDKIPEGHYESESMKQTVVPGRNMIFISILAGIAESQNFDTVVLGIHAGDHAIYPDCRSEFFHAVNFAIEKGTDRKINLLAPFLYGDKSTILKYGYKYKFPYHLTRTCYKDQELACGKCGACQERLEAFRNINHEDPIKYEEK